MDSEIVKGKPLTKEESKLLLELIENSKIITTKTTNATNNKLKNEEWIRITDTFNALASCPRTPQQLRLKWENLKKNARKRSTKIRMDQLKTGGGPADYIPPDDILDRVTSLLGSTVSGFTVPFGGDKNQAEFVVVGASGGCSSSSADGEGECGGNSAGHEDARVSLIDVDFIPVSIPSTSHTEAMVDCQILDGNDQNITTLLPKKLTFNTPRAVRKKMKPDDNRSTRNIAIADYYKAKRQSLELKEKNMSLQNENFRLRNLELQLSTEKLVLENEKLKLELEKLRNQQ